MVGEKYKKHLFATAFVLTVGVFFSGIVLGYTLDRVRINDIVDLVKQNELGMESYIIEQEFLATIGGDSCNILKPRFEELSFDLARIGNILTTYERSRMFKKADYDYLKSRYFNLEIQSYLLALRLKEQCNLTRVSVLYFYTQGDPTSLRQGYILDNLVEDFGFDELTIYSFDKDFDDTPLVDMVERYYNNVKISGLIEEVDLRVVIE